MSSLPDQEKRYGFRERIGAAVLLYFVASEVTSWVAAPLMFALLATVGGSLETNLAITASACCLEELGGAAGAVYGFTRGPETARRIKATVKELTTSAKRMIFRK